MRPTDLDAVEAYKVLAVGLVLLFGAVTFALRWLIFSARTSRDAADRMWYVEERIFPRRRF